MEFSRHDLHLLHNNRGGVAIVGASKLCTDGTNEGIGSLSALRVKIFINY